jgi:hypothetical protein
MNLTDMRTIVRRDLHDEDANNYRWTTDELDRHIAHAVKDYSGSVPCEQRAVKATTAGSREIDVSSLTNSIMIEAVEYPVGRFPKRYQRFAFWGDTITLLGDEIPDGSDAHIYYGKLHTLDISGSTVPASHEDIIATGACGYAAVEGAIYTVNRVNTGGTPTPDEFQKWGKEKLLFFREEVKRLGRKNRVRLCSLYSPHTQPVSKTTDFGP